MAEIQWQKPEQCVFTARVSTCGKYCVVREPVIKNGKQQYEYFPSVRVGDRWRPVGFESFEDAAGF